ncbi:hypothetical protein AMS68_007974 [Peltaster fructicola]|uniref:Aminoglycoside phosphotransferase domain-containing protein n=1 Tax=Peltaster fructicola TaxID=286661 RepID=A0A6H0Y5X7_9PEZI|nr:hypothetical protein AMS68_007974 [Peltaster fructicola]
MIHRLLTWAKAGTSQAFGQGMVRHPLPYSFSRHIRLTSRHQQKLSYDHEDFHRYTQGRFIEDEATAMLFRYLSFNVDELMSAAASAVHSRSCIAIEKCPDGMHNKTFLLKMDDGKEVIARLPNPNAGIAHYTTASEVATMEFMRTLSIPVPKVYTWCSQADQTAVAAEYIIMEKAPGVLLDTLWPKMDLEARFAVVESLLKFCSAWADFKHEGYGSIYFEKDLPPSAARLPFAHQGRDFALGTIVGRSWCDDGRDTVALDRGPWSTLDAYLGALGHRELRCIAEVSRLPKSRSCICGPGLYQPTRQKKTKAAHLYLKLFRALIPTDRDLTQPTAWHHDLHVENIFVDPDDPTVITSIIDWQSTEVIPLMVHARRPYILDHDGPEAVGMEEPRLPDNVDELSLEERKAASALLFNQALTVAYKRWVEAKYPILWKAFKYRESENHALLGLGSALFVEGEGFYLARIVELIQSGEIPFGMTVAELGISEDDITKIKADGEASLRGMELMDEMRAALGPIFPDKGWVRFEHYDEAKAVLSHLKEQLIDLYATTPADRAEWNKSWPFDYGGHAQRQAAWSLLDLRGQAYNARYHAQ